MLRKYDMLGRFNTIAERDGRTELLYQYRASAGKMECYHLNSLSFLM